VAKRTDVGYRRPPKEHRFTPGQSGNPKGRPRRAATLQSEILEELFQEITIKEDGQSVRVTKIRALLKATLARAIAGDAKATKLLLEAMRGIAPAPPNNESDAADDEKIIAAFLHRKAGRLP
jgi:hypothetical protein